MRQRAGRAEHGPRQALNKQLLLVLFKLHCTASTVPANEATFVSLKERLSCSLCLGLKKKKKSSALFDSQGHLRQTGPSLVKHSAVCTELSAWQRASLVVFYRNGSKLLAFLSL